MLKVEYKNIHLDWASNNEQESNGFVKFLIKVKTTLQVGDVIKNKANIHFDYNPAIITNETQTSIVTANPISTMPEK